MPLNFDDIQKIAQSLEPKVYDNETLKTWLNSSKIDIKKEYHKPKPVLRIMDLDGRTHDLCTLQNISATMGAAKSKKTYFSSLIMASLLGNSNFAINGNMYGRKGLFIDTEQSPYHVSRLARRIEKMTGHMQMDLIDIYCLRGRNPEEMKALAEYLLSENKEKYCFAIFDGIVDFMYDFNDLRESTILVNKLMKWSLEYNMHINSIIHTNKDAMNARGHLGAFLMNKAETVFKIKKTDNYQSSVRGEFTRNHPFEDWDFKINDEGLPERLSMPSGYYRDANMDAFIEPSKNGNLEILVNDAF